MRKARDTMMAFMPKTYEDVLALMTSFGTESNAHFRQASSYWEMVFSLANHGAVNSKLLLDNCGEGLFLFAKFKPYLARVRADMASPLFMKQTETFLQNTEGGPQRLALIEERIKKMYAAAPAAK